MENYIYFYFLINQINEKQSKLIIKISEYSFFVMCVYSVYVVNNIYFCNKILLIVYVWRTGGKSIVFFYIKPSIYFTR